MSWPFLWNSLWQVYVWYRQRHLWLSSRSFNFISGGEWLCSSLAFFNVWISVQWNHRTKCKYMCHNFWYTSSNDMQWFTWKKQAQLALKGNGRWDSDWFIARYAQKTPITHKENRKNPFRPCARVHRFKLAKVDSDTPLSAPGPCALDHVLISLKKGPVCYDIVECRSLETHQV